MLLKYVEYLLVLDHKRHTGHDELYYFIITMLITSKI
jgi:hypothetical protein